MDAGDGNWRERQGFLLRIGQQTAGVLLALEKESWREVLKRQPDEDKEHAIFEQAKAVEQCGGFDSEDFPPPLRLHGKRE